MKPVIIITIFLAFVQISVAPPVDKKKVADSNLEGEWDYNKYPEGPPPATIFLCIVTIMANNGRKRKSYIDSLPDRVFHGFTFRQGRPLKDGARRLICSHAESHACDALGTLSATDDFSYVPKKEKHTHERDPDAEIKARFTRDLYIATKHQFRTLQIIYDEIALLHEEGAALLSFNDINRKMQAWLENRVLPEVTSIGDIKLQLNDPLFKNINLHNAGKTEIEFVQDEEGQDTAMILVDANLLSQLETTTLFIQSTDHKFEGVDNLQLTSISTKHMDHILPLVWIILSDKNEKICESILRKILTLQPTLSPTAIYSEFDSDYWRAVKAVFPNVIIKGMFLSHCKIMINTAKLKNINLTDERTMSILSKIISMSLLPADKIVNSLREFVGSTMTNQDFENLNELMTFYDEKWLTSIDVENYSFYNDSMSLRKNGELILQDMKNRLKKVNALWNLIEEVSSINSQIHFHQDNLAKKGHFNIPSRKVKNIFTGVKNCKCISDAWKEIEAKVLSSIDLIMRIADNLTPILRNLSNSDVKIPIQFQLVNLTTNEENELIDADDELPILNSSDDEPIDDELPILNSSKDEPIDDEIPILYLSEDEPIDDELQILNSSEDEPMDDELPILISSDDEPIDHELPILNLSDDDHIDYEPIDNEPINDEPIDTLDEEEVQGYIYSQHCLGCYEDSIEIGYRPCTHAPYCWSCNKKWHDEAVKNKQIFTCILCRSAVEITENFRKDQTN